MPIWIPTIAICIVLFSLVLVFTKWQTKPRYHNLISWLGFLVSVMWIYTIANEIVHLLTVRLFYFKVC
jgi:FtsH-binding integral membrane protein